MIDYTCTDIAGAAQTYDVIYDTLGYSSYGRLRRNLSATGRYNCPVLSGKLLCAALATGLLSRGKAQFFAAGMQPMGELRELLAHRHRRRQLVDNLLATTTTTTTMTSP